MFGFLFRPSEKQIRAEIGFTLGVRRVSSSLTRSQLERLQNLGRFDLTKVRRKLENEHVIAPERIDNVMMEFRRYMSLHIIGGFERSISMFSREVDEVWHVLILHTKLYQEFCESVFGRFLHHEPFTSTQPDPVRSWQYFESLYVNLYGRLDALWEPARPFIPPPVQVVPQRATRTVRKRHSSAYRQSQSRDNDFADGFFYGAILADDGNAGNHGGGSFDGGGTGDSSSSCGSGDGGGSSCGSGCSGGGGE